MEKQSNSFLSKLKASFKRPRFVVEFVAWVLATALLIGALIGYGLHKEESVLVYRVGDKCPEFILNTYKSDNNAENFSTFNVDKVTVLNFWYTDCDPCKAELPYFEAVYEEYYGVINMGVIHSAGAIPSDGVQHFLDTGVDKNGRAWNTYKLVWAQDTAEINVYAQLGGKFVYPMTVVVNADRVITFMKQGSCEESELRNAIEKALNK